MTEKAQLKITDKYREFLYLLHRCPSKGVLTTGIPCHVEDPSFEITRGDVVHPCVRYIEGGFEGHCWWMVYTPFYAEKDALENPILCYADSDGDRAPTEWNYYCTIKDTPEFGYNSDPTLLFKDDKLYVFWREVKTPATKQHKCYSATFGCYVKNKSVTYLPQPLLANPALKHTRTDHEISPCFMGIENNYVAYAMHLDIAPSFVFSIPSRIGSFIYRHHIFPLLDALGIYHDYKSHGIAIWKGKSLDGPFCYDKTLKIKGTSRLHHPWHLDFFRAKTERRELIYSVIQSNMRYADIYLAWSKDGEHFHQYRKPLITSKCIGMKGIYKPCAVLVGKKFHLYYTAKNHQDYHLNRLFVTSVDWDELLRLL